MRFAKFQWARAHSCSGRELGRNMYCWIHQTRGNLPRSRSGSLEARIGGHARCGTLLRLVSVRVVQSWILAVLSDGRPATYRSLVWLRMVGNFAAKGPTFLRPILLPLPAPVLNR